MKLVKNYLRRKLERPYVYISMYFAFILIYAYWRLSRGDGVDIVMFKLSGILLFFVSTFCFVRLYVPELINRNVEFHINAYSSIYGLIFTAGLFILSWKPDRFDTGDVYTSLSTFVCFSLLQRHFTKRKCEEFAARNKV